MPDWLFYIITFTAINISLWVILLHDTYEVPQYLDLGGN